MRIRRELRTSATCCNGDFLRGARPEQNHARSEQADCCPDQVPTVRPCPLNDPEPEQCCRDVVTTIGSVSAARVLGVDERQEICEECERCHARKEPPTALVQLEPRPKGEAPGDLRYCGPDIGDSAHMQSLVDQPGPDKYRPPNRHRRRPNRRSGAGESVPDRVGKCRCRLPTPTHPCPHVSAAPTSIISMTAHSGSGLPEQCSIVSASRRSISIRSAILDRTCAR